MVNNLRISHMNSQKGKSKKKNQEKGGQKDQRIKKKTSSMMRFHMNLTFRPFSKSFFNTDHLKKLIRD